MPSDPDAHQRGRDPVRRRTAVQTKKLRSTVRTEYPLASLLRRAAGRWAATSPKTSWPPLLGVDPAATGLQQVNDFQLDLKQLKTVQPANAKEGYLYLQLPNLAAGGGMRRS